MAEYGTLLCYFGVTAFLRHLQTSRSKVSSNRVTSLGQAFEFSVKVRICLSTINYLNFEFMKQHAQLVIKNK